MPLAVLLGLGSAVCWGTADFFGGLQSRRLPTLTVVFWSQLSGALAIGSFVAISDQRPALASLGWGAAAGFFGGLSLLCFYRGLAVGTMSIVAPIAACGVVVPVFVSLLRGEPIGPLAGVGVAAAALGIVLVSMPSGKPAAQTEHRSLALLLALGAALGFGAFFVLIDQGAAAGSSAWTVLGSRLGSMPTTFVMNLLVRGLPAWPGRRILVLAAVGLGDTTANLLFALASTMGTLGIVAVLGSLYPVATVLLARFVLGERLAGLQAAGVLLALSGVVLISAG